MGVDDGAKRGRSREIGHQAAGYHRRQRKNYGIAIAEFGTRIAEIKDGCPLLVELDPPQPGCELHPGVMGVQKRERRLDESLRQSIPRD